MVSTFDDEHAFRELLNPGGLFPPERAGEFDEERAYLVFGQRQDARFVVEKLRRQAASFFDAEVGLSCDKTYGAEAPLVDAARVVVAPAPAARRRGSFTPPPGVRAVLGRPRSNQDLALAERLDPHGNGMALLARRCGHVWLIGCGPESGSPRTDRLALLLAAIFASVDLGPIIPPSRKEIFGVRTARLELGAD